MNGPTTSSQSFTQVSHPLLNRIKAEFIEMPGLLLTPWQAQRLWGLEPVLCDAVLDVLVNVAFLRRTPDGAYLRAE